MRLLCLSNGEFYIITVVYCVKTKVDLKQNRTILPISFGKVRLTTNYRMGSEHTLIEMVQTMLDNTKMV